eukprot:227763_1
MTLLFSYVLLIATLGQITIKNEIGDVIAQLYDISPTATLGDLFTAIKEELVNNTKQFCPSFSFKFRYAGNDITNIPNYTLLADVGISTHATDDHTFIQVTEGGFESIMEGVSDYYLLGPYKLNPNNKMKNVSIWINEIIELELFYRLDEVLTAAPFNLHRSLLQIGSSDVRFHSCGKCIERESDVRRIPAIFVKNNGYFYISLTNEKGHHNTHMIYQPKSLLYDHNYHHLYIKISNNSMILIIDGIKHEKFGDFTHDWGYQSLWLNYQYSFNATIKHLRITSYNRQYKNLIQFNNIFDDAQQKLNVFNNSMHYLQRQKEHILEELNALKSDNISGNFSERMIDFLYGVFTGFIITFIVVCMTKMSKYCTTSQKHVIIDHKPTSSKKKIKNEIPFGLIDTPTVRAPPTNIMECLTKGETAPPKRNRQISLELFNEGVETMPNHTSINF